MSKLKKLSSDDLDTISTDFGEILEVEVSKVISTKELEDKRFLFTLNIFKNHLYVDVDLGVLFDELSEINQDMLNEAIDSAYLKFDSYIDENFRE